MGSKEILTLQFGHYANFVGSHWWNIQEKSFQYNSTELSEINHDVLFREGLTQNGQVTYTPRLLLVDLKGSFKTLSQQGDLYNINPDISESQCQWDSSVQIEKEVKTELNDFQKQIQFNQPPKEEIQLDDQVEVWSDFLYSRFHPKTVHVIKEYNHVDTDLPFDSYPLGSNLWKTEQFKEDFTDNIRIYIEECDSFQGFHCLSDASDAFAGLSGCCLQYLKDEYDTKKICVFPLIAPDEFKDPIKDSIRIINLALTFDNLSEFSSLSIPLSTNSKAWRQLGPPRRFHHTTYKNDSYYHSSAILASALDTFTLKYRQRNSNYSLVDLCMDMTNYGRKVAAASLCLPFGMNKVDDLINCLDHWEGPLTRSITPNCEISEDKVVQLYTLRGVQESRLKRPANLAKTQKDLPAYKCETIKEMLSFYISCNSFGSITDVTTVKKALPVRTPYPMIFNEYINADGNIDLPNFDKIVNNVPVLSAIHNGEFIGEMLQSIYNETKRIKIQKFHQFVSEGIDLEEFRNCADRILTLRENYQNNYML